MLIMSQINHIKDLSNCGYRISEISKKTGADPKTIRKYLAQDDFSPRPPIIQEKPSKLDPFKPIIQEWLDEDKKHRRKQHHTAQRVYERLVEEHGYTGSYSIVQRYMKKCRSIQAEKANLELIWEPGPAQVDFGEADFYEAGKLCRKKYLTVSFPYSNDGYGQVLGGRSAMRSMNQNFFPVSVPIITSGCASAIPIPGGKKGMWSAKSIITVRTCLSQSRISMRWRNITRNCLPAMKRKLPNSIIRNRSLSGNCLRKTGKRS